MRTFHSLFQSVCPGRCEGLKTTIRRDRFKLFGMFMMGFLAFQGTIEKLFALPPLPIPTQLPVDNPLIQPQQNLVADTRIQTSLSLQLLNLLAGENTGMEGPGSSDLIYSIMAPLSYNSNPGLASGSSVPAWNFDPQVEMLHSGPLASDLLLTAFLEADTSIYPENSGYNQDTLSGEFQINFTDKGIHFKSAPFVAYKSSFAVPENFSGHAWVNDLEAGYNFFSILGTGGEKRNRTDPLEIDFNPGLSQRWIQIDDGEGNSSISGSSALELEIPFIYQLTSRLDFIFDFTAYTRYYDIHQVQENQGRVDEAFSFPLSLTWTAVPTWNLKIQATGDYTQQFSTEAGQDILQLDGGINLLVVF